MTTTSRLRFAFAAFGLALLAGFGACAFNPQPEPPGGEETSTSFSSGAAMGEGPTGTSGASTSSASSGSAGGQGGGSGGAAGSGGAGGSGGQGGS